MKKICVLPFMHALIQPDGRIKLCCNSENDETMPTVSDTGINDILNNSHHVSVRKQMLAGEYPNVCKKCWKNEELKIESYRQQQFRTYPLHFFKIFNSSKDGIITNGVKYLDVRFNNTCNLKCVMCSSSYSSSWIEDERKLFESVSNKELKNDLNYKIETYDKDHYKWAVDHKIFDSIINNASSLERIHFAGGEPLLSKQHVPLLKELIKLNLHKKLFLSYNTNGEFIDQELLDLWSHFKRVKVFYSLDHYGEKNEYIRYPSKWETVEEKIKLIEESSPNNIDWRLLTTIGALNIGYIPELVDWKIEQQFKKIHCSILDGHLFHAMYLDYPRHLHSGIFTKEIKDYISNKLVNHKRKLSRKYRSSYSKIIEDNIKIMNDNDFSRHMPICKEYLENLDLLRGTDFRKVFPLLNNLFDA
jgi:MoaA/NifB/PqqE/SkfB family radical SAM enzyme